MKSMLIKIITVIESCNTEEQAEACLSWIETLDISPMEREGLSLRTEKKKNEIMSQAGDFNEVG